MMGMFSWKCKGCGHELKTGEYVRMNGCVGEYDGYGRAGGFDYEDEEPSCWHVRCYKNASDQEKLDDSPSRYAPNQGFGFAALENRKNYDPNVETKYQAIFYVDHHDWKAEKTTRQQWYILQGDGGQFYLADQRHYDKLYEAANQEGGVTDLMWDEFDFQNSTEEEILAFYAKIKKVVEDHIGMQSPSANAYDFSSMEEAKIVAESLASQLTHPDWGYELAIFGSQSKANGLVYKFNHIPGFDRVPTGEFYHDGGPKYDYPFNGTFEDEVVFVHGRPASSDVKSY